MRLYVDDKAEEGKVADAVMDFTLIDLIWSLVNFLIWLILSLVWILVAGLFFLVRYYFRCISKYGPFYASIINLRMFERVYSTIASFIFIEIFRSSRGLFYACMKMLNIIPMN